MTFSAAPSLSAQDGEPSRLDALVRRVCGRIAPSWPLDRFIAVNPLWSLIDAPVPEVAATLQSLSGASLLMPRAWYREAYREGRLRDESLQAALDAAPSRLQLTDLRSLLETEEPFVPMRGRVLDVVDATRDLSREMSWRTYVTHSVSQLCAVHFDEDQAQLGPGASAGLFARWRERSLFDRSPALLMGARTFRVQVADLPTSAPALIHAALAALEVPEPEQERYLWSLLLDQNGWASFCAYRRWTARLEGRDDPAIEELLAIRLAWEWILCRMGGDDVVRRWRIAMEGWPRVDAAAANARTHDWLLQLAMEIAWRGPVVRALPAGFEAARPAESPLQAVFCIDVRSEVFCRALEAVAPTAQTLGFAGFFGLPIAYRPLGAPNARPQLPGLLAPRIRAEDTNLDGEAASARGRRLGLAAAWRAFKTDAVSTFTFVEAFGLTYAKKLLTESLGFGRSSPSDDAGLSPAQAASRKPRLVSTTADDPLAPDARADLAAAMLRGMSLTRGFARLVMLAGHGSATRNNPHAAGLDCGACCGQSGEVNARAAAALLNEPDVRTALTRRGIEIPLSTWFVAALHNTTTDEVGLFDTDEIPASHRADVEVLRSWLSDAGHRARAERAAQLGIHASDRDGLLRAVRARSVDWSQLRPEWGLCDNAAFIVAPREHCRHLDLGGRAFLHEYRHSEDEGYAVLEQIMTAPMVVTHWINFQYYASTVDNERYGSGNKVLHNVVGGHLGVFEGNGGDLRIGLPMQSLHDGRRWVHTPLRLAVFVEAPRHAIDRVVGKHANVRALVENGWLSLFQLDEQAHAVHERRGGRWVAVGPSPLESLSKSIG